MDSVNGGEKKLQIQIIFVFLHLISLRKNRYEKNQNMDNPFRFGTIVESEYFTDRVEEVAYIKELIKSSFPRKERSCNRIHEILLMQEIQYQT